MIKDRIEKIIRDDGMTSSRFADEIGVQRSSISHILSGRNNPSLELIQKILSRYRNVNPEWLINGTGEAYKSGIKQTSMFQETIEDEPESTYITKNDTEPEDEEIRSNTINDITDINTVKVTDVKREIEKIVIFYSDNTFKEFIPQ